MTTSTGDLSCRVSGKEASSYPILQPGSLSGRNQTYNSTMADSKPDSIELHPVGVVRNRIESREDVSWENVISEIRIHDEFAQGLDGIENFSHIVVVFWMHALKKGERSSLKVHPQRNRKLPLEGVFATRSPARPNPLGWSAVRLLSRDGVTLTVTGLDALDGSPVIDIKPYLPNGDSVPRATVAGWLKKT